MDVTREITPEMTLLDIVERIPETQDVFRQYEECTGTCLLCQHLFDSLESVASQYAIDLENIMRELRGWFE
ncbi:MAG: hypothetical protein GYA42_08095 [Syntrophomonadaceae bacterium]|nr:hypothetical protein [Syntrophomonadaceae bacterium]